MKWMIPAFVTICVLNLVLLMINGSLSASLERLSRESLAEAQGALSTVEADFSEELTRLSLERSRLADHVARLNETLQRQVVDHEPKLPSAVVEDDVERIWQEMTAGRERPDPQQIDLLTEEERGDIRDYRKSMPRRMNLGVLVAGDVDSVLEDPEWNPNDLDLDEEARVALADLQAEYRYYARLSLVERSAAVREDVDQMRVNGAFVEYPEGKLPEITEPLAMSHAEPSDRSGFKRLYLFYANEYPDLYHQKQVEGEQALRVVVDAHRLIAESGVERK